MFQVFLGQGGLEMRDGLGDLFFGGGLKGELKGVGVDVGVTERVHVVISVLLRDL